MQLLLWARASAILEAWMWAKATLYFSALQIVFLNYRWLFLFLNIDQENDTFKWKVCGKKRRVKLREQLLFLIAEKEHTMCRRNHFHVHSSVALSTLTPVCNRHHHSSAEGFSSQNPVPIKHYLPIIPSLGPQESPFYFVSMKLTKSYEWNHIVLVLLWLACFTEHNVLKVPQVVVCARISFFKAE